MKRIRWIAILLTAVVSPTLLAQTPVGWWAGEGNATDSASTNDGTVVSTFSFVPGKVGQAFNFSGGFVSVPDAEDLKPATVTLQGWVKGTGVGAFQYIISKSGAGAGTSYAMYVPANGGAAFFVTFPGVLLISPMAEPAQVWDGEWHQLTGTYDGTVCRLYVDGVEIGTGTEGAGDIDYTSPQPLVFGALSTAANFGYSASLDEVKLFGRALTGAEVQETFADASAFSAELVGWWKADGNALDSARAHHGTMTSQGVSFFQGKVGQAFLAQGGSVRIPSSTAFETPGISMQMWVQSVNPGPFKYLAAKSRPGWASYALYTSDSGGLAFFASTAGALSLSPRAQAENVWNGAWHQVTGTYDGSTVRLYVDGLEVGTGIAATGDIDYSSELNNGAFIIGNDPSFGFGYSGGIDEVKLFDRALTAEEVLNSYKATGIVSWWRAEENTDDSLGANHGTAVGTVNYVGGALAGRAFQTSGGLVRINDAASLRPAAQVSVMTVVSAAPPGANKYIISKSLSATDASYALRTDSAGGLVFAVNVNGGAVLSPSAPPSLVWDAEFHLVAGVYDGQKARLFVDGAEVGSGTAATGSIQYGTGFNSGDLILGDFASSPGAANYAGILDDIRIWNVGLTAEGVAAETFRAVLITDPPQSVQTSAGGSASFIVRAQGPEPLSYQWQFNGVNLPGQTQPTLSLAHVEPSQAGEYRVRISVQGGMNFVTNEVLGGQAFHTAGALARVPNHPSLQPQQFSLQTWVRSASAPGGFKYLVTKTRGAGVASYAIYTGGSGGAYFYVLLDGTALVLSPDAGGAIWDGNWHQLTGTFDGQYLRLYVDGQEVGGGTDSFGGTVEYSQGVFSGDFIIGDFLTSPGANNFPGDLDEVKLFNRALTAEEILETYNNPTGAAATADLISWWKGEGNALDSAGSNTGRFFPLSGSVLSDPVTLTVSSPLMLSNPAIVGGQFQATLSGTGGGSYRIEASGDLTTWTSIATNTVPFTFTEAVTSGPRFYRAVAQP
jgi:hypothetical protein